MTPPTHPAARIIMICPVCEADIPTLWEDSVLVGNHTLIIKKNFHIQCNEGHVHGAGSELRYRIGIQKEA